MTDTLTLEQVAKHNSKDDIWVAIHGKVYNVTEFIHEVATTRPGIVTV